MEGRIIPLYESEPHHGRGRVWLALAVCALLALALGLAWWTGRSGERALQTLSPEERGALFSETYAAARQLCAAGPALRDDCLHQSQFLLQFPECDAGCRAFVNANQRPASR